MVVAFPHALMNQAYFFQQMGFNARAEELSGAGKAHVNVHVLAESRRVVFANGASIPKTLQNWIGLQHLLFKGSLARKVVWIRRAVVAILRYACPTRRLLSMAKILLDLDGVVVLSKLQEAPDRVPPGDMPHSVLMAVERSLVDAAPPGTRVTVVCIPTLFSTAAPTSNKKVHRTPTMQVAISSWNVTIQRSVRP